jgi:trans-aconitate methyltransferase
MRRPNQTAELYNDVWKRDTYRGFSRNTSGRSATPLLDAFIGEVKTLGKERPRVVELGAGSCDHAMRCAAEGFLTTAVEYSEFAVEAARERFGDFLKIVQADLFLFTPGLAARSIEGVYANAVFHILSRDERRTQYRILRTALVEGGLLAISFKARGDALESRGVVVEETPAGAVVRGEDGIRRLFVADVDALADEVRGEGYEMVRTVSWSVPGYNVAHESGEFVAFLASAGSTTAAA